MDARKVILMDREIVMSPDAKGHIRIPELNRAVLLFERDGGLYCQASTEVCVNGQPMDGRSGIPLGVTVKVAGVSLVVRAV